jgi:hypothetical protein
LGLHRIDGNDFELVHPDCVLEREPDYQEGLELLRAGDPEGARDALRYALEGCGDNLWVHVALGQIALGDFRDPKLARGHFGYVCQLVERALPRPFRGRLVKDRAANRPFYEAADGLASCHDALGRPADAAAVRTLAQRLATGPESHHVRKASPHPPAQPEPAADVGSGG